MDKLSLFTLLLACATFLLAVASFWTIWQNHLTNKKGYKNKLLESITAWATETMGLECFVNPSIYDSPNFKRAIKVTCIDIDNFEASFRKMKIKGDYLVSVISVQNEIELKKFSEQLLKQLEKHTELIGDFKHKLNDIESKEQLDQTDDIVNKIDENKIFIDKSAERVIEEIVKISKKDIMW